MSAMRLCAIGFIYVCTTIGWFILGGTVTERTGESDAALRGEVEKLWGGRHEQAAPDTGYEQTRTETRTVREYDANGLAVDRQVSETVADRVPVPLVSSRVDVRLSLDYRRKGLLWYDTYVVRFAGTYRVRNPDSAQRTVRVHYAFPSHDGVYDGFRMIVNGVEAPVVNDFSAGVTQAVVLAGGAEAEIAIVYRSRGLDRWTYQLGPGIAQVRDFALTVHTDFSNVDFPQGTISPDARAPEGGGLALVWRFDRLVTGQKIGVDLPARLNPGPIAARISFFAPVSLLFFVTVMVLLGVLGGRSLHPMNYFFLAAGFFAFHLLLAYLVDHLDIHASFFIAAAASVLLVVSYLRLVVGWRFAVFRAGLAQLVFLVLFSYAFFFEGYTGLTVTVGAVVTLFILMQMTGRVNWGRIFLGERTGGAAGP